jgi:hypothetical protein
VEQFAVLFECGVVQQCRTCLAVRQGQQGRAIFELTRVKVFESVFDSCQDEQLNLVGDRCHFDDGVVLRPVVHVGVRVRGGSEGVLVVDDVEGHGLGIGDLSVVLHADDLQREFEQSSVPVIDVREHVLVAADLAALVTRDHFDGHSCWLVVRRTAFDTCQLVLPNIEYLSSSSLPNADKSLRTPIRSVRHLAAESDLHAGLKIHA